jgi:hypothetical protein
MSGILLRRVARIADRQSRCASNALADGRAYALASVLLPGIRKMTAKPVLPLRTTGFELRFQSLFSEGRALAFPCDRGGLVQIDLLSERARLNYLYARAVVGREYAVPVVRCSETH